MFIYLFLHLNPSHLPGVFHVVLLAGTGPGAAGGLGAALFGAAEHDGVLVEVPGSFHRHGDRPGLLAHVVAEGPSEEVLYIKFK